MGDRLAEIEGRWVDVQSRDQINSGWRDDLDWLMAEIRRLRQETDRQTEGMAFAVLTARMALKVSDESTAMVRKLHDSLNKAGERFLERLATADEASRPVTGEGGQE